MCYIINTEAMTLPPASLTDKLRYLDYEQNLSFPYNGISITLVEAHLTFTFIAFDRYPYPDRLRLLWFIVYQWHSILLHWLCSMLLQGLWSIFPYFSAPEYLGPCSEHVSIRTGPCGNGRKWPCVMNHMMETLRLGINVDVNLTHNTSLNNVCRQSTLLHGKGIT